MPQSKRSSSGSARSQYRASQATARDIGRNEMVKGVWTKSDKRTSSNAHRGGAHNTQRRSLLSRIAQVCKGCVGAVVTFCARHRIVGGIAALLLVLVVVSGIDFVANYGKIYGGVTVGSVDVGGMTEEEATTALENQYRDKVNNTVTVFFADEQARENATENDYSQDLQEQISYEESLQTRRQWTTSASELGGVFSPDELAHSAFEVGRDDGGPFKRIECLIAGVHQDPSVSYNDSALDDLAHSITASLGTFRQNSDIRLENGQASPTEGHDGDEVTSDWLVSQLNQSVFNDSDRNEVIVELQHLPMQITLEQAQTCADTVNASISQGAHFTYEGNSWDASREELAGIIGTSVEQDQGTGYSLHPVFDEEKTKTLLLAKLPSAVNMDDLHVTFQKDQNGQIVVNSNATGTIPEINEAVQGMNDSFFVTEARTEPPSIDVASTDVPSQMSFDDACSYGIVTQISSYTTEYAEGAEARNFNIHLMSDRLSNSICSANGGTWSFMDTAGAITEETGYKSAGAIVAGEYTDAIGGGVCQVATTVFNAIYTAGYPVLERHNHSFYIASYPEGRDAAVSDPDLDLRWENDSASDVLLVMSYTDSSVTASLYGVDPGYEVTTETGEWQEGDPYSTRYVEDDTLGPGEEVTEQVGSDGREISVTRTVTDADGKVLHQDLFNSVYSAKNEIIARGPSE